MTDIMKNLKNLKKFEIKKAFKAVGRLIGKIHKTSLYIMIAAALTALPLAVASIWLFLRWGSMAAPYIAYDTAVIFSLLAVSVFGAGVIGGLILDVIVKDKAEKE